MAAGNSLIAELENAISSGSQEKRVETLRRVTDLFLTGADRFSDDQIKVFDDVLGHIIKRIESKALVELSTRLAPVNNAPVEVIQRLARDNEIAVARPVLTQSERLTEHDLIEIAETKSQEHLLAISGRARLGETVTDVLLDRGDREVKHKLAKNDGARFSEAGFENLVKSAESDQSLAEKVGLRLDLPIRLFRELLLRATEAVRSHLLSIAPPEAKEEIQSVLATISNEVGWETMAPRDFAPAQRLVLSMQQNDELDETAVLKFTQDCKYEEMVAAISLLCSMPIEFIERLMQNIEDDGVLIACKAASLHWSTVAAVLKHRHPHHSISDHDLHVAKTEFIRLSQQTAQRVLRFWQAREASSDVIAATIR
jgi:Uncharacterised protein conserved in bacteria (DUF2336)